MTRIIVDGAEMSTPPGFATWRDLLAQLDAEMSGRREVVTAVRFDGVDEPAFRDPAVLARPLEGLAVVEIERGTPESLVQATIDEASGSVSALSAAASSLAGRFRGVNITTANSELADFAQCLATLVATVRAIGLALKVDPREIRCEGAAAADIVGEMVAHIESLIENQKAGDWLTVADTIEYELGPALARWQLLLDTYAAICSGTTGQASAPAEPVATL